MTLETDLDRSRLAAWRGLLHLHRALVDGVGGDLERAGSLPLTWYDVLLALYEAPERRLKMGDLADAIVFSPSGLTRLVDRLEAQGLLRREPCGEDRRCSWAALTDDGLDALRRTWPPYAAAIRDRFGRHLSDREVTALSAVLDRLLDRSA